MPDIYSKQKRSKIMAKISGKETKPEVLVRKFLFGNGLRYRKNVSNLPGKPDIVLPKYKTVIFVNGCFWHGHENCTAAKLPQTRHEFWRDKIAANVERDKRNIAQLEKEGWKIIVVWQCDLKSKERREKRLKNLLEEIKG
jgi:DNA mismatch endonuclease (patch repair protein)